MTITVDTNNIEKIPDKEVGKEAGSMTVEEARKYFVNDRYAMATTGIQIDAVDEHYAKCSLKLDERHMNAVGQVMGGVAYTLADFVFAVATNACSDVPTVTTVSQISYLGVVKGDTLIAESELLREGRRNCFYLIHIKDNLGNPIAVVNTSGAHLYK